MRVFHTQLRVFYKDDYCLYMSCAPPFQNPGSAPDDLEPPLEKSGYGPAT